VLKKQETVGKEGYLVLDKGEKGLLTIETDQRKRKPSTTLSDFE
jgi:hypothetical protein